MLYALSLGRRMGPMSYVHPTYCTPAVAIAIHAAVALALALPGSFRTLALMSAGARLVTYLMTCISVPFLRKLSTGGFRTPGLIVPILGVAFSLVLVYAMKEEPKRALALGIGLVIGALIYFFVPRQKAEPQPSSS